MAPVASAILTHGVGPARVTAGLAPCCALEWVAPCPETDTRIVMS
jgi:hypothetical protein